MGRRVPDDFNEQELASELMDHIARARNLLQTLQYPQEHIDWSQSLLAKLWSLREKIVVSLATANGVDKEGKPNLAIQTNSTNNQIEDSPLSPRKAKKVLRVKKK